MNLEKWLQGLWSQERAIDNARAASTELARRRLERNEAELFLEEYAERRKRTA